MSRSVPSIPNFFLFIEKSQREQLQVFIISKEQYEAVMVEQMKDWDTEDLTTRLKEKLLIYQFCSNEAEKQWIKRDIQLVKTELKSRGWKIDETQEPKSRQH